MVEDTETRAWLIRSLRLYGLEDAFFDGLSIEKLREMLTARSILDIATHQVHVADSAESGHTRNRKRRVNHADDLGY